MTTDFTQELVLSLKNKGLASSSVELYIRNLEKLNGNKPLKNLNFLKKVDKVLDYIKDYAESTKRSFIIAICSVLNLDTPTKAKKKLYDTYFEMMVNKNKEINAEYAKNEKSEKEKKKWISWEEVMNIWKTLEKDSLKSYDSLLQFVVLSLYVLIPPRRNDYQDMYIIKGMPQNEEDNYLDVNKWEFVFNRFKTFKKEGKVVIPVPSELRSILEIYLKNHPLYKGKKGVFPFLVDSEGKPISKVNGITRLLAKSLGVGVGSSMLRHIFISHKFADSNKESAKIAGEMSHSVGTQQGVYLKH